MLNSFHTNLLIFPNMFFLKSEHMFAIITYEVTSMIFKQTFSFNHIPSFSGNHPVTVVANFAVDGRFIPIYFRYVSEDSSEYTYKIHGIRYIKDKHDGFTFCCLFINNSMEQQVILSFITNECQWILGG